MFHSKLLVSLMVSPYNSLSNSKPVIDLSVDKAQKNLVKFVKGDGNACLK